MNEFTIIKGYVSAAATLVQTVIEIALLPKQMILDDNDESLPLVGSDATLSKISSVSSLLSNGLTFVYYYDLYYEDIIKSNNKVVKWAIFGLVAAHLAAIGILFFLLLKQNPKQEKKLMNFLSGYLMPPVGLLSGIATVVLAHKSAKTTTEKYIVAYFDLAFGIIGLWKLAPVKTMVLKAQPFGPVIIAGLLGLKAGATIYKVKFIGKED